MIKVSVTKIRATGVGKLGAMADNLKVAMTGPLFIGTQPFTPVAFQALITNFTSTKALAKSGGNLAKPAYVTATAALKDGIVLYAPYIDLIAKGDVVILALTPLPTTAEKDFATLILAGALAAGMFSKKGMTGQFITNCTSYGPKVGYFAIVCEGGLLPAGVTLDRNGQLKIPSGCTMNIFCSSTSAKKKTFSNLTPGVSYFVYYVLTYGTDTVGFFGTPLEVICSN
jgi:hypothetical protein